MLTPLDISNKEFRKGMRGYDTEEVDEFLNEVIRDFETLYKENLDLKDKMQKQEENINQYKEIEQALQNTLVLAQKIADEVKQNAQKEAELQIWEARKKGEQIIAKAEAEITDSIRKIEKLRGLEQQMFVKIRSFLMTQIDLVDNYDLEEDVLGKIQKEVEKEINNIAQQAPAELAEALDTAETAETAGLAGNEEKVLTEEFDKIASIEDTITEDTIIEALEDENSKSEAKRAKLKVAK